MKKIISFLLVGALGTTLFLAACGKNNDQPAEQPSGSGIQTPAASAGSEPGSSAQTPLLGGWEVAGEFTSQLTDDERAIFDKALEGLLGASYEPAAVIATQLVAGTNLAYLCTTTPVVPNGQPHWTIVVVYKDLQGNASLKSVMDLDLANIVTMTSIDSTPAVGAWEIVDPSAKPAMLPTEKAQAAFDNATRDFTGVGLHPIALLGTQLVNGTNYKVLCAGQMVTGAEPATALFVVDIYEDLEGNAMITDNEVLDLLEYVTTPVEE